MIWINNCITINTNEDTHWSSIRSILYDQIIELIKSNSNGGIATKDNFNPFGANIIFR